MRARSERHKTSREKRERELERTLKWAEYGKRNVKEIRKRLK